MSYAIDQWGFVRWEGPPPGLMQEHVAEFSRLGVRGVSAQRLGIHGDPFAVQLTAWYPNESTARVAQYGYRANIGTVANVVYENINYTIAYGHRFLVHMNVVEMVKRRPLLVGPGINYSGGWEVVSQWTLVPWGLS